MDIFIIMNKESKIKYKNDFVKVTKLINEFDPCGLIEGGAPVDEYESLTNNILSSIYNRTSRQEIKKKILNELIHYFGKSDLNKINEYCKTEFLNYLDEFIDKIENEIILKTE